MNPFDAFIQAMAAASMETLRHFDLPVALSAGMAPDRARAWDQMQDVYYGATKFTRKQGLNDKMCVWLRRVAGLDVAFLDAD